jgi:hypothetical protein
MIGATGCPTLRFLKGGDFTVVTRLGFPADS